MKRTAFIAAAAAVAACVAEQNAESVV